MINIVFNWCVVLLRTLAGLLGTTYEAVNVWIFCVIEPLAFVALVVFAVYQNRKLRELRSDATLRSRVLDTSNQRH